MSPAKDPLVSFLLEGTQERIDARLLNGKNDSGLILASLVKPDPRFPTTQAECWYEGKELVGRPQQPL